jgi:hypothetical protein
MSRGYITIYVLVSVLALSACDDEPSPQQEMIISGDQAGEQLEPQAGDQAGDTSGEQANSLSG